MREEKQQELMLEAVKLAIEEQNNVPMKIKREFKFVRDWGKMPVIRREHMLNNMLAYGAITTVNGLSGARKTHLEAYIASIVTTGGTWFNGQKCEQGCVIYINLEDTEDELIARLTANGVDFNYLKPVRMIPVNKPNSSQQVGERSFSLPEDLELLKEMIEEYGAHLVIIDSIRQVFRNHTSEPVCKAIMGPLAQIAMSTHCAVMLVNHLEKRSQHESPESVSNSNLLKSFSGAQAITAMARCCLFVYKTTDNPSLSAIRCAKSNIGREDFDPIFYTLHEDKDGLLRVVFVDRSAIERENEASKDVDELSAKQRLQGMVIAVLFDEELTMSQLIQRFNTVVYPIWVELTVNSYVQTGEIIKLRNGSFTLSDFVRTDLVQQGFTGKQRRLNPPKSA